MIVCPHCGSAVNPEALHCGVCGGALEPGKIEAAQSPPAQQPPGGGAMKKTMMGMSPNVATPAPAPVPAGLKGTMIGMPAGGGPPPAGGGAAAAATAPGGVVGTGGAARPGVLSSAKQTIIGVASPLANANFSAPAPAQPPVVEHKRTMMGVAMPGIAPLAPGVPKESFPMPEQAPPADMVGGYAPAPPTFQPAATFQATPEERRARSSRPPPPRPQPQYSTAVAIVLVTALVLAAGAAAFAIFWRSPAPLRAEARVDATGTDLLHITCVTCSDGTELRIGDAKATVSNQVADIPLAKPLTVGENVFSVDVDRPANGRDEKVSLIVKIGYRIRPDLSGLDAEHPVLRIAVDGAPLAKMVIDGKPLDLGPDGKGKYEIDVTAECTGLADDAKTLERSVSYSVASGSGTAEQGVVGLRVAITPLHVDSPNSHSVVETDRFLLAGRTGRGGRLLAGGEPIAVTADGSFSKVIAAKAQGDNVAVLRATVPGQAPRIASLKVKRVERLFEEAKDFAASAPLTYAELAADVTKHVGEPIVLAGDVVETRQQGGRNISLIDVQKGCPKPPCVARALIPGNEAIVRGERLQVFGYVTRAISAKTEASGAVPEIESAFFLKRH
jgi:hypothetical protein